MHDFLNGCRDNCRIRLQQPASRAVAANVNSPRFDRHTWLHGACAPQGLGVFGNLWLSKETMEEDGDALWRF